MIRAWQLYTDDQLTCDKKTTSVPVLNDILRAWTTRHHKVSASRFPRSSNAASVRESPAGWRIRCANPNGRREPYGEHVGAESHRQSSHGVRHNAHGHGQSCWGGGGEQAGYTEGLRHHRVPHRGPHGGSRRHGAPRRATRVHGRGAQEPLPVVRSLRERPHDQAGAAQLHRELRPRGGFGELWCKQGDSIRHPDFKIGYLVSGITGWEEYTLISNPESLFKINHPELPLSYYAGVLGMPGLTAWAGIFDLAKPKKGDNVFVSAALGAVGQVAGQLAKLKGCYVVGSAGSDNKVNLLKTKLGFDEAFNYKKEKDLNTALKRYFPQGIDIYFENVGGATLDAVVLNMRQYGQIPLCRMISQYYLEQPEGVRQLAQAIIRRVRMEGFLVFDYFGQYRKFEEEMAGYLKECKICYIKDIACGLEKAPAALIGLFSGRNVGKQLVALDLE